MWPSIAKLLVRRNNIPYAGGDAAYDDVPAELLALRVYRPHATVSLTKFLPSRTVHISWAFLHAPPMKK